VTLFSSKIQIFEELMELNTDLESKKAFPVENEKNEKYIHWLRGISLPKKINLIENDVKISL
jgi:hypothetical protein